ncbi:9034_t:CDS:2, partial [Acaulospora colombiana]
KMKTSNNPVYLYALFLVTIFTLSPVVKAACSASVDYSACIASGSSSSASCTSTPNNYICQCNALSAMATQMQVKNIIPKLLYLTITNSLEKTSQPAFSQICSLAASQSSTAFPKVTQTTTQPQTTPTAALTPALTTSSIPTPTASTTPTKSDASII